jgi:hypothetical protein
LIITIKSPPPPISRLSFVTSNNSAGFLQIGLKIYVLIVK